MYPVSVYHTNYADGHHWNNSKEEPRSSGQAFRELFGLIEYRHL